jgi:ATP-binding cassette subfamily B protein
LSPPVTGRGRPQKSNKKLSFSERISAFQQLPAFFKLIWETSPKLTLANIILRLFRAAIPLSMLYVGKLIIDEVVRLSELDSPDFSLLITYVVTEFALALLSDALNRGIALTEGLLGDLFANESSIKLMQQAARLDLYQFENSEFYDKLERARQQTVRRTLLMSQVLSQVQDLITVIFLAAGLIVLEWWLLLLVLIAVIPAFLGESHFNERSYSLIYGWTPERRELDYLRYTGASDETAKEIKMFGLSGFLIDRFRYLSDKFYNQNKSISVKRAGWGTAFSAIGSLGYYGAYAYIIYNTVLGRLSVGDLTFYAGSFSTMRSRLEEILNRFSKIAESALYLRDFFDFFALKPQVIAPSAIKPFPKPIQQGFEFQDVGFKYPHAERWAIRNLNFKFHKGEKIALVGENGAGKTTLVKLLTRLYDPNEGRILLDGIDLKEYDPEELRDQIGVIFQDYVRFNFTAADNIAVGRIEKRSEQHNIKQAAQRSLADTVVEKLPQKYEQMIGRRFADGVDLSGGEWQKLALARAYMRDAQVLILDEPTAALDARSEHEVFQRFAELTTGKMAVLISHRFSTVRMADRILVLEGGRLLEEGNHEDLLNRDGRYAELFELQARGYS